MADFASIVLAPYVGIPLLTIAIGGGLSYWIYADGWDRPGAKLFVGVLPTQHLRMALLVVHVLSIDLDPTDATVIPDREVGRRATI